jgi:hypothetical protein
VFNHAQISETWPLEARGPIVFQKAAEKKRMRRDLHAALQKRETVKVMAVEEATRGGAGPGDVGAGHCLAAGQSAEVRGGERFTMLM